uniref:Putative helicase n=1 Tax=viral metagenome TaxID=1070528 RepID=A0A6M3LCF4_9ZZZZ
MTRNEASTFCREELNKHNLSDWHIRLVTEVKSNSFLGKCSYKDKSIYLNAHHIDTHLQAEVENTILHEIAHALTEGAGHDDVWKDKAKELGCTNTLPCATYGLSLNAIDAIRSGALLEIDYDEQVIRTPKYRVTRYQDKCDVCNKVAKEASHKEFRSNGRLKRIVTLECGHIRIEDCDSQSPFEDLIFDSVNGCAHDWNKTVCMSCGAKKLYPFQIEGARFLERQQGKAAIFDEMGLGKTIQALAYLKFHEECFPALFIVKSGIKFQWMKEIVRVLGEKYFPQVISDSKQGVMPGLKCYITGYDLLRRFDSAKLKSLNIKTVVLDEVQAIKNPDASRTQEVRKLCKEIEHLIPLSGTPWKNRGSEFFVVLNMMDPIKFWSYQSFLNTWVDYYWDGAKQKEGGIRNPAKFKEHIKDLAIRRERTEVMPELPLINRMRLNCQIEDHARKAYENEVSEFVKWYNQLVIDGEEDSPEASQNAIARLQRMRHIIGLAKIPTTIEWCQDFIEETERKLVVFVHHKDVGALILDQLKEVGKEEKIEVMQLSADMSGEERFTTQERFNKLPRAIMVASTLASGEGLNLQTCSDCVMHERQWNPMNEEQAEGRFVRIGQIAQSVNATYIHAEKSTDTHLDTIIETKRSQFHAVMNKGEIPVWNQGSLIKELTNALVNERNKK